MTPSGVLNARTSNKTKRHSCLTGVSLLLFFKKAFISNDERYIVRVLNEFVNKE